MTKWEYCQVTWTVSVITQEQKENLEKVKFQGKIEPGQGDTALAYLGTIAYLGTGKTEAVAELGQAFARLGQEGWELVDHAETTVPNLRQQFWFKRPVED